MYIFFGKKLTYFIVYINNLNDELSFKNGEEDINYYLVADPIIISKKIYVMNLLVKFNTIETLQDL